MATEPLGSLVPYVSYSQAKSRPAGEPLPECLTCPRLRQCPLKSYQASCVFRKIYIDQGTVKGVYRL